MQLIKKIILGAVLFSTAQFSFACTWIKGATTERVSVGFAKSITPSDVGIGDAFATSTYKLNNSFYYKGCTGKQALIGLYEGNGGVSGEYDTIPTGVPGVGVRISLTINGYDSSFGGLRPNINLYPTLYDNKPGGLTLYGGYIKVELVRTANVIGSGKLSEVGSAVGSLYHNNDRGKTPMVTVDLSGIADSVITNASCRLDSNSGNNLNVTLRDVSLSSFTGVGSTSGETNFDFKLICSGGDDSQPTTVRTYFSMASETPVDANKGILTNEAKTNAVAKNIGVQVMLNGNPIKFNERYQVGTIRKDTAVLTLPMSARYYQYGNKPTGGSVESRMTYNITYD